VEILPYLEQEKLYMGIDRTAAWDAAANKPAVETALKLTQCSDWVREATPHPDSLTPYVAVAGVGAGAPLLPLTDPRAGIFGYDRRTAFAAVKDGTANTLLILESAPRQRPVGTGWAGYSTRTGAD
jgi:hypothetical protein